MTIVMLPHLIKGEATAEDRTNIMNSQRGDGAARGIGAENRVLY
jgi:hypothetical protein